MLMNESPAVADRWWLKKEFDLFQFLRLVTGHTSLSHGNTVSDAYGAMQHERLHFHCSSFATFG